MNSRLQQLADQATEDILGVPILNQERFARLIVEECAAIARAGLSPAVAEVIQDWFERDTSDFDLLRKNGIDR